VEDVPCSAASAASKRPRLAAKASARLAWESAGLITWDQSEPKKTVGADPGDEAAARSERALALGAGSSCAGAFWRKAESWSEDELKCAEATRAMEASEAVASGSEAADASSLAERSWEPCVQEEAWSG
jgi:hypothetical protein